MRWGVVVAGLAVALATVAIYPLKAVAPAVSLSVVYLPAVVLTDSPSTGLSSDDLRWLLERVPAEMMILRTAPEDTRRISAASLNGHF
jgi:hypothetical protein